MQLSGHTQPFAVLGHPIGHTLSPVMHNAALQKLGMDAIYLAFDVAPNRLLEVLPAMRDMGFGGVNLTIPLKEVAFKGLTELDASATRVSAVNTIEFLDDGTIKGHSTDGKGFLLAIEEDLGIPSVSGMKVFVLGAGGAGRTLALTCADEGAARVVVADIDSDRATALKEEIASTSASRTDSATDSADWPDIASSCDLIIQATPVGMKETDASLLPGSAFRSGQFAYDLVYMYPRTAFMKAAVEGGARAANGLGMLLHQGAWAFTIWTGKPAAVSAMREALEQAVYRN